MLRHCTRKIVAVAAPLLATAALIVGTPSNAAAQTSWGFGVVIGHDQRYPAPAVRGGVYWSRNSREYQFAYNNGYRDGTTKGREDWRNRRSYDLMRHRWYRNADRDYDRHYGFRIDYEQAYRDGFRAGYQAAYRNVWAYGRDWRDRDDRRRPY